MKINPNEKKLTIEIRQTKTGRFLAIQEKKYFQKTSLKNTFKFTKLYIYTVLWVNGKKLGENIKKFKYI